MGVGETLSVRIDADLKRRLKVRLAEEGISLASWIEEVVRAKLRPAPQTPSEER